MKLPAVMNSYREYRFPWNATPATPPAVVASSASGSGTTQFAVSWNGATGVLSWQVLAGASASTLAPVGAPVAEQRLRDDDHGGDGRALRGRAGAGGERCGARHLGDDHAVLTTVTAPPADDRSLGSNADRKRLSEHDAAPVETPNHHPLGQPSSSIAVSKPLGG
jgi:hypothetical protein